MNSPESYSKYKVTAWFVGGLVVSLLLLGAAMRFGGLSLVTKKDWQVQQEKLARFEAENLRLREERWRAGEQSADSPPVFELPYDEQADARVVVSQARQEAVESGRFLMITFGANWCLDCRTLYRNLRSGEVAEYTAELFRFASVNVGKFNRNRDLASELGVDLSRGIPVAIFFDPQGRVIGTTNEGQLEPARLYSSKQILRFMKDIAERSRIVAPNSVGI